MTVKSVKDARAVASLSGTEVEVNLRKQKGRWLIDIFGLGYDVSGDEPPSLQ